MKIDYKLYKPTLDNLTPRQQILYNRNIPVKEQSNWLNAYWNDINDFHLLKNIKEAASRKATQTAAKKAADK